MRYYPRLGIYKSPTGNNTFDGHEARSYNWYVYAVVALNGTVYRTAQRYSVTTSKHESEFSGMVPGNTVRILAPNGLKDMDSARAAIADRIATLTAELANPRNRARQRRMHEIERLQAMLPACDALEADYAARRSTLREVA